MRLGTPYPVRATSRCTASRRRDDRQKEPGGTLHIESDDVWVHAFSKFHLNAIQCYNTDFE